MSKGVPEMVEALVDWRKRAGKRQKDVAEVLHLSPRVYVLFENGHWLPPPRETHFFAHTLHGFHPPLGEAFARACGTTTTALGLPKAGSVKAITDKVQAQAVYDAAVYAAAEEAEIPARTARGLVAAVLDRIAGALTLEQARELGHRAKP